MLKKAFFTEGALKKVRLHCCANFPKVENFWKVVTNSKSFSMPLKTLIVKTLRFLAYFYQQNVAECGKKIEKSALKIFIFAA